MSDQTTPATPPTDPPRMDFVGVVREFQPSIHDLPLGPRTTKTNNLLRRGQLHWAGDDFLRPGLYIWTGEAHVLVESKHNIQVKMEAGIGDPNAPVLKSEWRSPLAHEGEE